MDGIHGTIDQAHKSVTKKEIAMDYKILVPSGIGDFSWLWSKIVTTPHRFHVEYIGGTPDRMRAFLNLLPKDRILSFKDNVQYVTKWNENNQLVCFPRYPQFPQLPNVGKLSIMNPNYLYFLENNSFLEAGNRIEEWCKSEIPNTDFHYHIDGKLDNPVRGNYFVVNFSSYGTKKAWGYYDVSISAEIVEYICKSTGWEALFIGGSYDDYTQDIFKLLHDRGIKCRSIVGQTPSLIEVIPLLQQSRFYAGACSGLMVLSNNLFTPTLIYYPPFPKPPGRKLAGMWHDQSIPYLPLFWEGSQQDIIKIDNWLSTSVKQYYASI